MAYGYVYQPYKSNAGWGAAATAAKVQAPSYGPANPLDPAIQAAIQNRTPQPVYEPGRAQAPSTPSYYQPPSYNWQNDPFLMETKAMTAKSRTEAEAQKNDQLRKHILSSGLTSLAEKLFGSDTAFIESVRTNPFSGVGEIKNAYEGVSGRINQANEQLNQANLFFSSHRTGEVLPQIFRQRQADEYDLTNQTQASIDSVNAAYTNRLEQLRLQEMEAERQAWMNAMQMGAAGGYGPSGGGGGGGGAPLAARPGEWADVPIKEGWEPHRNTDARYDMSYATPIPGGFIGPQGQIYDENGRVR